VGLGLCPFANEPLQRNCVRFQVCQQQSSDEIFAALLDELEQFVSLDAVAVETGLFIVPNGLAVFDDYLSVLYAAEDAIQRMHLQGVIQLASFHPVYCFKGATVDDPVNYTNRSPYPMFHVLREASLDQALRAYPNPERIPERNIETLTALGLAAIRQRLEG